ncbi:hypothetical protein F8388_002687 [Cannabis sativa]|uniref:Gag1-like clamp domain-containing protein n=1 Tax=Cannabis sativa TaxID=3483 RepID=A0A7J6FBJ2_CANSA|nr:hypothetical protein F8388_002687 [Cannabis sativa]KAF4399998.1 hypothetical protein G4B88_021212 [Cannabis sativa]
MEIMEVNAGNSPSNGKQASEHPNLANTNKKPAEKEIKTSVFVNYAAIAWNESRKEWVGDKSQQVKRMAKDPIISWSTAYEDLLSTHEPFPEPIPLPR